MPGSTFLKTLCLLPLLVSPVLQAADETSPRRKVLQPVHTYSNLLDTHLPPQYGAHILNGFLNYTHLGSDFGFVGPGQLLCDCRPDAICAELPNNPDAWAGVWHSLNGLAREHQSLDLRACYPLLIAPAFQPKITGLRAVVTGKGMFKLELKSVDEPLRKKTAETSEWIQKFPLEGGEHTLVAPIDSTKIPTAQFLNWIAEPGADLCVDSLSLEVELPPVDFPTYVFLASYAKLARCYDEGTGLVRDRAHITATAFNNVAATGMFALATAAAQRLGVVEEARARETLRHVLGTVLSLPRERGLLPHFVYQKDGRWAPLPGSEYSTIDTALCLISLRLAAQMLNDTESSERVLKTMQGVAMNTLRNADGYVLHGLRENGEVLASYWKDWGGETALVLILQRIAAGPSFIPKMDGNGRTHRGIGFISELPALFLPQFNTDAPGRAGRVDWRAFRRQLLTEQKAYFPAHAPQSLAAQMGLYGLSAGEGARGRGYHVGGVEDQDQQLISPHYILMSALLEPDVNTVYDLLRKMEARGWFPPWGLPENIDADGTSYLPMLSSLNASFEALAAYHLLTKYRQQDDEIYRAATNDPIFQDGIQAVFE